MNIGLGIDDTVLPINHTIRSEIRMLGSFCYDKEDFHDALSLLVSGKISHDGWTEVRPLAAGGDAFADLRVRQSGERQNYFGSLINEGAASSCRRRMPPLI